MLVWVSTIWILSSMSPPQLEKITPFEIGDKVAHFVAFAAGAVNLSLAWRWSSGWSWLRIILLTVLAISAFGAIDEYHQLYTPNRMGADVYDWTADTLGAITGVLLTAFFHARLTSRKAPARN